MSSYTVVVAEHKLGEGASDLIIRQEITRHMTTPGYFTCQVVGEDSFRAFCVQVDVNNQQEGEFIYVKVNRVSRQGWVTHESKRGHWFADIRSAAWYVHLILLSGDVEANPGPFGSEDNGAGVSPQSQNLVRPPSGSDQRKEKKQHKKGKTKEKKEWVPRQDNTNDAIVASLRDELSKVKGDLDAAREKIADKAAKEVEKQSKMAYEKDCIANRVENLYIQYNPMVPNHYVLLGMEQEYEHTYEFLQFEKNSAPFDLRADATALLDLKHEKPQNALFRHTRVTHSFWSGDKKTVTEFVVSLEALAQLCAPSIIAPYMDPVMAAERLRYAAQSLYTVNVNRYDALNGDFPIQNAVYIAYALYVKSHREMARLDFHTTPANTPAAISWTLPSLNITAQIAAAGALAGSIVSLQQNVTKIQNHNLTSTAIELGKSIVGRYRQ